MTVDLYIVYTLMLVSITLILMQRHKFSVELFQQLSKQQLEQALNLLQVLFVTLSLQTFISLDQLVSFLVCVSALGSPEMGHIISPQYYHYLNTKYETNLF